MIYKYLLILLLSAAIPAHAQTSATVSLTSDYVSRGTSQTYAEPAAQIYVEHQIDNFYIAGFISNVDFKDGTALETDLFGGYRGSLSDTSSFDLGVSYIGYQGTKPTEFNPRGSWDMVEATAKIYSMVGPVSINATVGITPEYFGNYGPSIWLETETSYTYKKATISSAIGRQFLRDGFSYTTWNAGLSYNFDHGWGGDIRYSDTNRHDLDSIYRPRVAVTLRKNF